MTGVPRVHWIRVVLAVVAAEVLSMLALILVVFTYSVVQRRGATSPQAFAPAAGNWVGPIGGFVATFLFAAWASRHAHGRGLLHGLLVGVGSAVLDLVLGLLLGGAAAVEPLFLFSYAGRVLAGILGGWVGPRPRHATGHPAGPRLQ